MSHQLFQLNFNSAFAAAAAAIQVNSQRIKTLEKEEEEADEAVAVIRNIITSLQTSERTIWKYPTSNDWWNTIYPHLPDHIFVQHFRVDRPTFKWIVEEMADVLTTKDTKFRNAIELDRKVAACLKCLATTCDLLTIAALFGIGRSNLHRYFLQFINAFYTKLVPKVIQFPGHDEIRKAAEEFEQLWAYPMAFSAIDGTHIPFNPPINLSSDFHNYKGWSSIMAIAMCDARGKVIWLKTGIPGRASDSGAFKSTSCYAKLQQGDIIPPETKSIGGKNIPYHILGDSGFAMESWLIKTFTHHGTISENQRIFNYRHSKARRVVENLFGRVKSRWRRLLRGLDVKYENAHRVISVAFALHNICESRAIDCSQTSDEVSENAELENRYPQPVSTSTSEATCGVEFREALMNYFCSQRNPWTGN